MTKPHRTVGIDFGTSTSLAAEGIPFRPTAVVPLGVATSAMPSWVGVTDLGLISGEAAQSLPLALVARSVKRAVTRGWATVSLEGDPDRTIDADHAISAVLREIGTRARNRGLVLDSGSIRLGCPAMWNAPRRQRLLNLAQGAGIPVGDHTLIDEPIAAGVAWIARRVHDFHEEVRGRVLVFDMGGGTLDVALLDVEATPGRTPEISVLASAGRDEAGDELDRSIERDLVAMLGDMGVDVEGHEDGTLNATILQEARRAKEMLSSQHDVVVAPRHPTVALPHVTYTREQLEVAFEGQLRNAYGLVEACLRESLLTHVENVGPVGARRKSLADLAPEVDYVVLVGGMSQIPVVQRRLGETFPGAQLYTDVGVRSEEAIVAGLADTAAYDRINLHRPGFDFVLEWDGQPGQLLYEAYSPFYESWEAMQRTVLYYERRLPARELPAGGTGALRIRTTSGGEVALQIEGTQTPGLPVPFGRSEVMLRIYPNGHIIFIDGKGHQHQLRVARPPRQ
jgi:molecular chaperone DnaK (HSP70)